ncbi:MAG: ATP-binding protein [Verrucomicrobiales bacterium]|nr:ATP-binding protein [Verrucomicrobiales bacterium]
MPAPPRRFIALICASGVALSSLSIRAEPRVFDPTEPTTDAELLFQRRVFTRRDGLPSDNVRALHIARNGTLWIGTDRGLSRLINGGFQTYNHATNPIFRQDTVTAIEEGPDGTLWAGTLAGLIEFSSGTVRRYTTDQGLTDNQIVVMKARRNGDLWFGTQRGLHRLSARAVTAFATVFTNATVSDPAVYAMLEDRQGRLWITGRSSSARQFDDDSGQFLPTAIQGNDTHPLRSQYAAGNGILEDAAGRVWISGVPSFVLDANGWNQPPVGDPLERGCGSFLGLDSDGTFWLREWASGLVAYRSGRIRVFTANDGIPSTPIQAFAVDRLGALWFGTPSGLCRWLPRRFPRPIGPDLMPNDAVWTMTQDSNGATWIGTDRGVFQSDPSGRLNTPVLGLADLRIRSLHFDQSGVLWMGTMDSLECWRDSRLKAHSWEGLETYNKVRVVTSDPAGRLWVGRERGLMCKAGDTWRRYQVADGLPHDDVRALHVDRAGNLWIGTFGGGLAVVGIGLAHPQAAAAAPARLDLLATRSSTNGLPGDFVWAIHEDSRGYCWLGTDRGLVRMSPAPGLAASTLARSSGLFEETINEVLEDDHGSLWFSTDRGFGRIGLDQAHAVADGRASHLECQAFTEADGLLTGESNGQKSQPAGMKDRLGRLWFPTPRGVCVFDPTNIAQEIRPPILLIDRIRVDHETVYEARPGAVQPENHRLEFKPGRGRAIEIAFANPEFREGPPVRLRHRLVGFDDRWVESDERRFAIFTNLRPGAYRFEAQAAANHSVWSDAPVTWHLVIQPWFYQTTWFRASVLATMILGTLLVIRGRERHHHRLAELHRQVSLTEERQRIARDVHDEVGSGLLRLAIIGENALDREDETARAADLDRIRSEAHRLVDQLGDLIWAINPKFDSLDQILARLREHAASFLQDARIEHRLDFPESPAAHLRLPAVVRQNLALAFKEVLCNAVKHSAASRIDVRCDCTNDWLNLAVSDNGQGMSPSPPPNQSTKGGQGSSGMRHRLERAGGQAVIDSTPGAGTTVTLRVPLIT